MKAVLFLLLPLAACGDTGGRGFAASPDDAPPHAGLPSGSVATGTVERIALVTPPGPPVSPALLEQGRAAYLGKCAACHGVSGLGDGPVVMKGFTRPPPLSAHSHSAEDIVAVVSHGRGAMPAMAEQVPPFERWAVARYLERTVRTGGYVR